MPPGSNIQAPALKVQQVWDVAAYMNSQPHPLAPPEKVKVLPASTDEAAPEAGDAAPN
jgi:cytochrome c